MFILSSKSKKAQVWYIDFTVGLLILISSLLIYYNYQGNLLDTSEAEWQEMLIDSKAISSNLISGGYPSNWTNASVGVIGLTDGNYRINSTKAEQFENMSYKSAKELLKTRFDFYFFIENGNSTKVYEAGMNATNPKFLVQATRFAVYNSKVSRMVLYLWQA